MDAVLLLLAGVAAFVFVSGPPGRWRRDAPPPHEVPLAPLTVWDFAHPLGLAAQCTMERVENGGWEVRVTREHHVSIEWCPTRAAALRRARSIEQQLLHTQWQRRPRRYC